MMLRRFVYPGLAMLLAVAGARSAGAAPITFTGNVQSDFSGQAGTQVIPGLSNPLQDIAQAPWITNAGYITGWAIKDIDLNYDKATDTMYVGVQTFTNANGVKSIAGDAYGSGQEGNIQQQTASGGINPPYFGAPGPPGSNYPGDPTSDKSITLAFASNNPTNPNLPGTPTFVAGIPANKAAGGPGIGQDGFNVSSYANGGGGIQNNFGQTLVNNLGSLAFNPDASHPDLEFTIKNFSKAPGVNLNQGFWVEAYAGSAQDGGVGETFLPFTRVIVPQPQVIPEPTTVLAWSLIAGAAACARLRRKARA